ncbi:MAG: hypothetical protein HY023_09510 [Chloroflexi bacterium]|nr:hypothetical protein [Chloroflexota bacterium]
MTGLLRRWLGGGTSPEPESAKPKAKEYLARVQAKIAKLAEDFAAGTINRAQFQELYSHYQREIRTIEQMIEAGQGDWQSAVTEGQSVMIRKRNLARAEGYAVYENESGMPLATLGSFQIDSALLVPMLSSYRAATAEIFGAGMRSTAIEGGRWLCFVPGQHTTLMALFTVEVAPKQMEALENIHRVFESANRNRLASPPVNPTGLIFPHEYFLGTWRKGS